MNLQQANALENYIASHANNGTNMFASVVTETEPKMNKTGNPYYGQVKKISHAVLSLGHDYESAVNNRRGKEGETKDFEAEAVSGRRHVSRMILESTKNPEQKYLQVFAMSNTAPKVTYRLSDGTEISARELEPYMPKKSENTSQGLENPVRTFSYKLENVKSVTINGQTFG